jgi:hypothetical protein
MEGDSVKPTKNVNDAAHTNSGKKAYQKPQLEVFGNLGDITQTVSATGTGDAGHRKKLTYSSV